MKKINRLEIVLIALIYNTTDRMVKMKIITPIEEPTDWVSSLVIVEKPNG